MGNLLQNRQAEMCIPFVHDFEIIMLTNQGNDFKERRKNIFKKKCYCNIHKIKLFCCESFVYLITYIKKEDIFNNMI